MSSPTPAILEQQTEVRDFVTARGPRSPSEPFPSTGRENEPATNLKLHNDNPGSFQEPRQRGESGSSTFAGRIRSASKKFEESSLPKGMWDATASIASSIPSLADIRGGSFGNEGWSAEGQIEDRERRSSIARRRSSQIGEDTFHSPSIGHMSTVRTHSSGSVQHHNSLREVVDGRDISKLYQGSSKTNKDLDQLTQIEKFTKPTIGDSSAAVQENTDGLGIRPSGTAPRQSMGYRTDPFDNGYHFPPKHTWTESTTIFLKGFWNYTTTWLGFLVVIYGLNVVAWGAMIFFLLCNAAPAMCHPTCNDIDSPRRIWIEIDSQILTALFCVTGFGLIPWRFRDFYYLLKYRLRKDKLALRRLAGIHRDWFRLEGSQNLPVLLGPENIESEFGLYPECSIPYPLKSISNSPLAGIRAPPTASWKLDYVIWMFVWNTFLQAVLSGLMWGLNRYNRPSWSTGVFVALACIVAACGGIMIFVEGKKVKGVEGVPVSEKDQERLKKDRELGIMHINNINDEIPKEKKGRANPKAARNSKTKMGSGITAGDDNNQMN